MTEHKHSPDGPGLPLPNPRSGSALDDKILAYARANAPRKRLPAAGGWVAGLATASVVAVAILVAVPPGPGQQTLEPTAEQRGNLAAPATATAPAPEPAPAPAATAPAQAPAPAAAAFSKMARRDMLQEESPAAESREIAPLADSDYAAGAAPPPPPLPELDQQLKQLAALQRAGRETEAATAYQALRESCSACGLPETLELALKQRLINY